MNMRVVPFVLVFLLAPLASQGQTKFSYEQLEELYNKGSCERPPLQGQERRLGALLFLEDVLTGAAGSDSLTSRIVGDISIFQIGNSPDETLVALYEYAQRKDVSDEISSDTKKMGVPQKLANVTKETRNKVVLHTYCSLYLMVNGKGFEFKNDLDKYFQSLNRKVRNRNIENLNRLTREYQ